MKILIVEDEPGIVNFLKDGLTEEYFAVDAAYDGRQGLEMALSNDYNIILLDWMIPGISGIEFLKQFRNENKSVPIIFITAKDTTDDIVFALDNGANDYIKKPFKFSELLARIRVQLRKDTEKPNVMSLGSITIQLDTHQVFVDNNEVILTKKEFELLELLLSCKGRVCTRTRIIEQIWESNFEGDSSVIDVYINALRKKLGLSKESMLIQTIRGVGYVAKESS